MKVSLLPVCPVCDRRSQPLKDYPLWNTCGGCRTLSELPSRGDFPATILAPGAAVLRAIERLTASRDGEDPATRLGELRALAADATAPILALPEISALARGLRLRTTQNLRFPGVAPAPGGAVPAVRPGVQRLHAAGGAFDLPEGGVVLGNGSVVIAANTALAATGTMPGCIVAALPNPGPDFTSWGEVTALALSPDDVEPA